MYKGKNYDQELKKHGVSLDRQKADDKARELDVEALDSIDKSVGNHIHRRVTGR